MFQWSKPRKNNEDFFSSMDKVKMSNISIFMCCNLSSDTMANRGRTELTEKIICLWIRLNQ